MNRGLVRQVRDAVRTRLTSVLRESTEPGSPPLGLEDQRELTKTLIADELNRYALSLTSSGRLEELTPTEEEQVMQSVLDWLFGLGPLQRLIDDEDVENINVNGADVVWVKRSNGEKQRWDEPVADSDDELAELIRLAATTLAPTPRQFNSASPQLDMRLPDGSRLSAILEVSARPSVSIRRHRFLRAEAATLDHLVKLRAIDHGLSKFFRAAVKARKSIVVAGGTNAGKTTLLRALANQIPPEERLVTIEKALELGLDRYRDLHPDCVAMEAREPNTEGEGAITMSQLVRRALRMDPDRVIVGEVLGDEVIDMLNAMSQGNDGSLCTIHANSSEYVARRIGTYAIQSVERLPIEATNQLIAGAIDFIVFIDQRIGGEDGGGQRRTGHRSSDRFVSSVREVLGAEGSELLAPEVFKPRAFDGRAVPSELPQCSSELERVGWDRSLFEKTEGLWD